MSGFVLYAGKAYCSCRDLRRVHGRRTEAVESCVVWWEGVLKLSGCVLRGGKAYRRGQVLCCVVGRRTEAVGSCVLWW